MSLLANVHAFEHEQTIGTQFAAKFLALPLECLNSQLTNSRQQERSEMANPSEHTTGTSETDGRTDGQTDRQLAPLTSKLTRSIFVLSSFGKVVIYLKLESKQV